MNKMELVQEIAKRSEVSKAEAEKVLNSTLATIKETLANGDNVKLVGFGTFEVKAREARMGRNPRTGEAIPIEAKLAPTFKAGEDFKREVNK